VRRHYTYVARTRVARAYEEISRGQNEQFEKGFYHRQQIPTAQSFNFIKKTKANCNSFKVRAALPKAKEIKPERPVSTSFGGEWP
jgi:hypothetical protein